MEIFSLAQITFYRWDCEKKTAVWPQYQFFSKSQLRMYIGEHEET